MSEEKEIIKEVVEELGEKIANLIEKCMKITTWNYRVVRRHVFPGEDYYAIHEVFYDAEGNPTLVTTDAIEPGGETLEELEEDFTTQREDAFRKPVLNFEEIGKPQEEPCKMSDDEIIWHFFRARDLLLSVLVKTPDLPVVLRQKIGLFLAKIDDHNALLNKELQERYNASETS